MKETRTAKRIYLDYAATTPVRESVLGVMKSYWHDEFGNPGGLYKEGVMAKESLEAARSDTARILSARREEIIFTGSGTEANNLAILGVAKSFLENGRAYKDMHFITGAIEHSSVMEVFHELKRRGARVTYIGVTKDGIYLLRELEAALTPKTILVSLMHANNEIGTVQPLSEARKILSNFRKKNPAASVFFHTDASNVPLYLPVNVDALGVHLMTLDGQKIYGPKGVGMLYIKRGVKLAPILYGGAQERGLRPGTENIPGICGFAKALAIASSLREKESERLSLLRDYFIKRVLGMVPGAVLNGDFKNRLPNNINFSFPGHDNEWIVLQLDAANIAVATRSACLTEKEGGSYVIEALGRGGEYSKSSVRITLGEETTKKELNYVVQTLARIMGA